tara:strand:+ start:313 stop:540 length:228 start_codon:yes stop_codon:yes gene_type:complete
MTEQEFNARFYAITSQYDAAIQHDIDEAADNLYQSVKYDDYSEDVLDMWAVCLGGAIAQRLENEENGIYIQAMYL